MPDQQQTTADPTPEEMAERWAAQVAERPWLEHARRALFLVLHGENRRGGAMVDRMVTEHGSEVVPGAMQAWIDTMLAARPERRHGQAVRLSVLNADTGAMSDDVGTLPRPVATAVQLIAARAADDEQGYRALVAAVPDDDAWRDVVWALLSVCALNLRVTVPDL